MRARGQRDCVLSSLYPVSGLSSVGRVAQSRASVLRLSCVLDARYTFSGGSERQPTRGKSQHTTSTRLVWSTQRRQPCAPGQEREGPKDGTWHKRRATARTRIPSPGRVRPYLWRGERCAAVCVYSTHVYRGHWADVSQAYRAAGRGATLRCAMRMRRIRGRGAQDPLWRARGLRGVARLSRCVRFGREFSGAAGTGTHTLGVGVNSAR